MPIISALNIYPVKACRGIGLTSAQLTPLGLIFDREWVIVKADNGKFLTQRQIPQMALIETSLPLEALSGGTTAIPADAALTLSAPGLPALRVPLLHAHGRDQLRKVTVAEWTGGALDEGDEAAAWLSSFLGTPCRLMRYVGKGSALAEAEDDAEEVASGTNDVLPTSRLTDQAFADGYNTRFSDGFPILLANEASLADLNTKMAKPLPMNRFRPNVIVTAAAPWAEDTWRNVSFTPEDGASVDGGLHMIGCKPCARCKVTTINQLTAAEGEEPLDTLGDVRSGKGLGWAAHDKTWTHKVFFGWNMVTQSSGTLSVGDEMHVLQPQTAIPSPTPA